MTKLPPHIAGIRQDLGAVFLIPKWKNRAQINAMLKDIKPLKSYRGIVGRTLFFEFKSTHDRDEFLKETAAMIESRGNQTETINRKIG